VDKNYELRSAFDSFAFVREGQPRDATINLNPREWFAAGFEAGVRAGEQATLRAVEAFARKERGL